MNRAVAALVRKEMRQIRRDPIMLRLIFAMPIIQLLVLGYAISTEVDHIDLGLFDYDWTAVSRELVRSFTAAELFVVKESGGPVSGGRELLRRGETAVDLVIEPGLRRELARGEDARLGLLVDGANANSASIAAGYASRAVAQFNERRSGAPPVGIALRQRTLYNPSGESVFFMVPGIVAVLLTMITVLLTAMAIVRERERGTLEQLMVTPISRPALILGKIIPFAILGYIEMSVALAFGVLWFRIPFVGSWLLLYALSFVFLLTTLGVGMLVSTLTSTQQQAMFFAWFFSIFAILTSGFFIPIENMPPVVRALTYLNPVRYYMTIVRGVMMKGAAAGALRSEIMALAIFAVATFSLSWLRFSKRVK